MGIVQNTPSPPSPPPMPTQRVLNYVETVPITPARVIYQRWSNWANTRLVNFPPPNPEQSEDADLNEPSVNDEVSLMEPVGEAREAPQQKTITAKGIKEKKRKLAFEVPEEEKMKCNNGKWSYNCQGGEVYCIDGFSYLVNNHNVSKKTGFLTIYLICSKCGGRNILVIGLLKKPNHPGHSCSPDPDNWELLQAGVQNLISYFNALH